MSSNTEECYLGSSSCDTQHYHVALVQADNLWALEKNADKGDEGDPYPGSTNNTVFSENTSPNSNLYDGSPSNVMVTNISKSAATMIATLSVSGISGDTLTVSKAGTGLGKVTSSPVGIDCGSYCSENYVRGQVVTLTATPGLDQKFEGWGGACTSQGNPCILTVNGPTSVIASFIREPNPADLGTVTLSSPEGIIEYSKPSYVWFPVTGANSYNLVVTDSKGSTAISLYGLQSINVCVGLICSTVPNTALADGSYRWTMRACTSDGCGPESSKDFVVSVGGTQPTGKPEEISPSGTVQTATPAFSWTQVTGDIASYEVIVYNQRSSPGIAHQIAKPPSDYCSNGICKMVLTQELPAGTYWWDVTAYTNQGLLLYTNSVMNFTVTVVTKKLVSLVVEGQGSVSSTGINCPGDCSEYYPLGTQITLNASASNGEQFKGWAGACKGQGNSCLLTVANNLDIKAQFTDKLNWLPAVLNLIVQ